MNMENIKKHHKVVKHHPSKTIIKQILILNHHFVKPKYQYLNHKTKSFQSGSLGGCEMVSRMQLLFLTSHS